MSHRQAPPHPTRRYYIIAGEASGDLHAAHLVSALSAQDPHAEFRGIGGERMAAAGVVLSAHYSELAYMGFVQVALHLPQILRHMAACKAELRAYRPDALILVDYPGFNLRMAAFATAEQLCPVYYYIAPKIWAWKEGRIHQLRRNVTQLFSILPFEVDYFAQRHGYPVHYVGNPTLDEISAYTQHHTPDLATFCQQLGLPKRRILALLPGSRRAEIQANLPTMLRAAAQCNAHATHHLCIAAAPNIPRSLYETILTQTQLPHSPTQQLTAQLYEGESFALLQHSHCALVTSGTATLETALFAVPQIVCYAMRGGRLVNWLRPLLLKVPFISLPNLICGRAIVPELIAGEMNVKTLSRHLAPLLCKGEARATQRRDYETLRAQLGQAGAPQRCATAILAQLNT